MKKDFFPSLFMSPEVTCYDIWDYGFTWTSSESLVCEVDWTVESVHTSFSTLLC